MVKVFELFSAIYLAVIGFLHRSIGAQVPSTDIKKVNHKSTRRKHVLFLKAESWKRENISMCAIQLKRYKRKVVRIYNMNKAAS